MLKFLIPFILFSIGTGAGVGAALFLGESPEETADGPAEDNDEHAKAADDHHDKQPEGLEYVKLNNQFVVPVVSEGRMTSMVVLALNLEVTQGSTTEIYAQEPKIRDAFLQILFDHANLGGFDGAFTSAGKLELLKRALLEMAQKISGDTVREVLISDIARQDI